MLESCSECYSHQFQSLDNFTKNFCFVPHSSKGRHESWHSSHRRRLAILHPPWMLSSRWKYFISCVDTSLFLHALTARCMHLWRLWPTGDIIQQRKDSDVLMKSNSGEIVKAHQLEVPSGDGLTSSSVGYSFRILDLNSFIRNVTYFLATFERNILIFKIWVKAKIEITSLWCIQSILLYQGSTTYLAQFSIFIQLSRFCVARYVEPAAWCRDRRNCLS